MIAFNVGDSHTTVNELWCSNIEDHYWYNIAKHDYGCVEIINDSVPGRSNNSMCKAVVRHCLENPNADVLYIINITTIFRIDLHQTNSSTLKDVLTPVAISNLDFEVIECSLYAQLIGVMELLKARGKEFLIINNCKNFSADRLPIRDAYITYFKEEPRILNWFNNSRVYFQEHVTKIKPVDYDKYGWNGHDNSAGHLAYYGMLKSKLHK